MALYRKKPVIIEAQLLTRENFEDVGEWAGVAECWGLDAPIPALHIRTLEGTMKALLGDWVIKGVQGEFYPCKPDIFDTTYELVSDAPSDNPGRTITR
jgi:hypothetical protein